MSHLMSNPENSTDSYQKNQHSRYSDVLDELRKTQSIVASTYSTRKKTGKEANSYYFNEKEESKRYWDSD